jgi:putative spermidine/putrescine transport system substrate-binding protein
MADSKINRMKVFMVKKFTRIVLPVVTSLSLLLAACGSGEPIQPANTNGNASADSDGKVHLTMFIWAGSHQGDVPRKVVAKYLESHPNVTIDFVESNNTITYPKMIAAKRATPDKPYVDFGFFNASTVAQGDVDDMWDSLDPANVPNINHVIPEYRRPNDVGVGYVTTLMGLLYNKEKIKTPPTSWTALWDPANKGRVTTFDYQWQALTVAARLNGGGEANIDPGFKLWSEHADQFKALVNSNDQLKNLLVSGDAWIAPWFSNISQTWIDEGAPLEYVNPKEGAIAFPAYLQVVKGITPEKKKIAEEIINLLLEPENIGEYGALTYGVPVTDNAKLSDAQKNNPNLSLEVVKNAMQLDWGTIAKNDAAWKKRWDQEVKAKMN